MKRLPLLALASVLCVGAHAQVTIYNGLNAANVNYGFGSWDGGSGDFSGSNFGDEQGQVITNTVGATTVTSVEGYFLGYDAASSATGMLVQVYNFSGGTVGSLVGQQVVTSPTETDTPGGFVQYGGAYTEYDITASVNISGLVAGNQYLVALQGQGPNWGFIGANTGDGNSNVYSRNNSANGYSGDFGTDWAGIDTYGYPQGDLDLAVTGTAAPEPATYAFLALGVLGVIRRRRRA